MIICRCEEVSYHTLLETANQYQCGSRELKLRTRAGMGYCGGRTCGTLVHSIINEVKPMKESLLKHQPPVRPVTFHLLGEGDHGKS